MENSDSNNMIFSYIHDLMMKRNLHQSAELLAQDANLHSQDDGGVMIDTPEGFLQEWFNLVCNECRAERAKLRLSNNANADDTSSSERFLLTCLPMLCRRGLLFESAFPPFYSEYCAEIAKHVSEYPSPQAIEENAANVPIKLDFMDREIAKKILWKMSIEPSMF